MRDLAYPRRSQSWEIREKADNVTEAIERLFRRLHPVRFSIVQCVGPDSDLGFAIDAEDVRLLAEMDAFIDIDQYALP